MSLPPQVTIIIVNYNTRELLLECINSVIDSSEEMRIEIIVVDNDSKDGSAEAVRGAFPEVVLLANSTNLGFGAACNQAIKTARSPFVLLLNSDARLTAEALKAVYDCMESEESCGAAGCKLVNAEGRQATNTRNFLTPFNQTLEQANLTSRLSSRYLRRSYSPKVDGELKDRSVDWIDGACLMLRRAALDEVGLFDERFFMYSEDEDLCLRLKRHGWSVCYSAAGTAFHRGGATTEKDRVNMLTHFYFGQILFLRKHRGRSSALLYLAMMKTVLTLKRLLLPILSSRQRGKEMGERIDALGRAAKAIKDKIDSR